MSDRLKAVVVDSQAARDVIELLTRLMFPADSFITPDDILKVIDLANDIIGTYLTDPPYLEELLEELVNADDPAFENLMEQVGELIDNAAKFIYYDVTEVKHTFIGDDTGMVMLMI